MQRPNRELTASSGKHIKHTCVFPPDNEKGRKLDVSGPFELRKLHLVFSAFPQRPNRVL